jgi:hypothetical protein
MDGLLERTLISPQRSSHFKIFFSGQAMAAGMVFDFLGKKGGSTDRAEGRLNPVDL